LLNQRLSLGPRLLLSHDRVDTDELIMTQELIADMLGVRRERVTVAAGHLQDIEQSVMCAAAYRSWTARSRKKPHASVIELSKRSSSAYLDNRGALLTDQWLVFISSGVITEELPSFPSLLFFEVSTIPIASFARLRTMRLFSKNTLSHARLVVCGK
jgi:hypothetical protein